MKKWIGIATGITTICVTLWAGNAQARPKVIYGDDNRLDLYQVEDSRWLGLADSTVALFDAHDVTLEPATGSNKLTVRPFRDEFSVCTDEPFYEQDTGAFCSGSLVAPDLVLTAGHCVSSAEECSQVRFVFGFGIGAAGGRAPQEVQASEVYSCTEIVGHQLESEGADFSVIKLDRPVVGHAPLEINRSGIITDGTPLVVIGHPSGLPTKVSAGANVRSAAPGGFFVANLDTYGGNSGSPVFNTQTGMIEGVLVRGEMDFTFRRDEQTPGKPGDEEPKPGGEACRISFRCPDDGCRGEDVTKIVMATQFIPENH